VKRVFVCSPYRGDVAANVEIARAACREVLRQRDAPLAPHLHYPDLLDDEVPDERALGMSAGRAWLLAADEVLVVGPVSPGMREEIDLARARGIPVRHADDAPRQRATWWDRFLDRCRGIAAVWEDRAALAALLLVVLAFLLCPGCAGAGAAVHG
jgi:hypothetical protein